MICINIVHIKIIIMDKNEKIQKEIDKIKMIAQQHSERNKPFMGQSNINTITNNRSKKNEKEM